MLRKILVIDDEKTARDNFEMLLSREFQVFTAGSVSEGIELAETTKPDAVLTDLQMPKGSGIDFCKKARQIESLKNTPIIVVSGIDDVLQRTDCFLYGADDFIAKPFAGSELMARISAKLKFLNFDNANSGYQQPLVCGNLTMDDQRFEVMVNAEKIPFTNQEFVLLAFLIKNANKVVSREMILESLWSGCTVSSRTVDTHVCLIREKLVNFDHEIQAIRSRGYILLKRKSNN